MQTTRRLARTLWAAGLAAGLLLGGCSFRDALLRTIVSEQADYFNDKASAPGLSRLTGRVYTFTDGFNRNLVVDTPEGLVVVDSFNRKMATQLLAAIGQTAALKGKTVRALIYSHFHLDHTGGGAVLNPGEVVAHERCPAYWADRPDHDLLPPTRLISGDQELSYGGMAFKLISTGPGHTDTMYAVHLPGEKVLFTADTGFVHALPPLGIAAGGYSPAYRRALDRLAELPFDTWVPSHHRFGTKADLKEYQAFIHDLHQRCRAALARQTGGFTRQNLESLFDEVYPELKKQYGDWHGFDQGALILMIWATTAELLGN
jgi:glyoxylase-like metal-dependent hydrolase (beta-lactamase superfamily II)